MPPKYPRRILTIAGVLMATVVLLFLAPIWLPLCAIADLMTSPRRMRFCRLGMVVVTLCIHELLSLAMLTVMWSANLFGLRNESVHGQRRLQRVLSYYARGLVRATRWWLGLRVEVEGLEDALDSNPALLVFSRHTSLLDSAMPVELLFPWRYSLRYAIKESLKWAPVFDMGGHMLPVHFVNRRRTNSEQLAEITDLVKGLGRGEAAVIFPEGTFFNPARRERAIARIAEDAPHLLQRAEALRYTLPPRAGGALAMLAGAPDADVLMIAHSGLESFVSIPKIMQNTPLRDPVRIKAWRVPTADIPTEPSLRYDWLFGEFEKVDEWLVQLRS